MSFTIGPKNSASQIQPPKATTDRRAALVRQDARLTVGSSSSQNKIKKIEKPTWNSKHQQKIDQFVALLADAKAKLKEIFKQAKDLYKAMRGLEPKAKDALYQGVQNLPSPDEKSNVIKHVKAAEENGELKKGPLSYLTIAKQAATSVPNAQHDQPKPPSAPNPSMVKSSPPTMKSAPGQGAVPNPLEGKALRNWTSEGFEAMQTFLFALTGSDDKAKADSFNALRAVIRQVTDITDHSDVEELEAWIEFALKDRSKQEVEKIVEWMKGGFGVGGHIFDSVSRRLLPRAEALLRQNEDYWQAKWNERGKAQAKEFVPCASGITWT